MINKIKHNQTQGRNTGKEDYQPEASEKIARLNPETRDKEKKVKPKPNGRQEYRRGQDYAATTGNKCQWRRRDNPTRPVAMFESISSANGKKKKTIIATETQGTKTHGSNIVRDIDTE